MIPFASKNIEFVAHSDLGGNSDGVQVMVQRGYAYIGHGVTNRISTLDVRDPKNPKVVDVIECPPGTRAFHLQAHGDLLLTVNAPSVWTMAEFADGTGYFNMSPADKLKGQMGRFTPGLRVYDISNPAKPVEIGFMPVNGLGPQRIWYTGGRYAYVSIHLAEFTDHVFNVVDLIDPTRPEIVGKCWLPGMWAAGGETPTWKQGVRYAMHHCVVAGNLAYTSWRDGGMTVIDISEPTIPRILVHCHNEPPYGPGTHSPLPIPSRDLLVLLDEPTVDNCREGLRYIWMYDVRDPAKPKVISNFPQPEEADYCAKGGAFGPHNFHEMRPGSFQSSHLIFTTYYNAGVRVYDIKNQYQPKEVGYWVPPNPTRMIDPRPNKAQVPTTMDCYVDPTGLMYLTDQNAGLYILQYQGQL